MTDQDQNPIREAIEQAIAENPVILFMKGNPDQPACGFSARSAAALRATGVPFAAVDILPDPRIRQELSALSDWPTIPQLFIKGELIGGCDIIMDLYASGELYRQLGVEPPADAGEGTAPDPDAPAADAGGPAPLGIDNRLR